MILFSAGYSGTIIPIAVERSQGASKLVQLSSGIAPNSSGAGPSWLAFSHGRGHTGQPTGPADCGHLSSSNSDPGFYSVDENSPGRIFSHTYQPSSSHISATGSELQRTKGTSTGGDGPVSCVVGHGHSKDLVFIANYNSGTAAVIRVNTEDGALAEEPESVFQFTRPKDGSKVGPVADRQDHSYAHQVAMSPSGRWVYVCDLGADQIHHLYVDDTGQVEFTASTDVEKGSGPRHLALYRDESGGVFAYLASELDNKVTAFVVDETTGVLQRIQAPMLASPPGVALTGPGVLPTNRTTAEIAIPPTGDFVYVSNRGDMAQDHISIFKRNSTDGTIAFLKWVPSGGRTPRHFSLSSDTAADPAACFLVVGHQTDQNLVLFRRDQHTGDLTFEHKLENVGQIAFAGFAPF